MIPSRPVQAVEQRKQSVSERLARLRAEQTARDRPRFSASTHASLPNSANARWLEAATNAARHADIRTVSRPVDRRRGTAGPPPPKSWSTDSNEASGPQSRHRSAKGREDQRDLRAKVARPLPGRGDDTPSPKGLYTAATKVVAEDLSHGPDSLLADFIDYLPLHLRLRILDVYADWRNELVLDDDVLRAVLIAEPAGRFPDGSVPAGAVDGISEGVARMSTLEPASESPGAGDDWESAPWHDSAGHDGTVESLDLSFSAISLRMLRSVLLRDYDDTTSVSSSAMQAKPRASAPPQAPCPPPKFVATFPGLHTLNLTSTARVPFSDALFDTLSHLMSLRHLSLNGKSLSAPSGSTSTSVGFLRLAAATPNLQTLDLSYMDLDHSAIARSLDWNERWLDLRVLGVRSDSDDISTRWKDRLKRDIQEAVASCKRRKRRWIEVVT